MTKILTQAQMTGPHELHSREQIRAFWEKAGAKNGFAMRVYEGDQSRELRTSDQELVAYINDGRWVADCRTCNGGIAAGPDFDEGCCLGCGTVYPLKHPSPEEIQAAEEILAVRPPLARHWRPSIESVDVLAQENAERGYMTDADRAKGELEQVAAATGLKVDTVRRVIAAQEKLGRR